MEQDGRMLGGRYRLEEAVGRGGMSTVYRATDEVLDRTVAVKVLSAALAEGDPVNVARFEREARAAASLAHPAVVAVYDSGLEEGMRYIVMEYVHGRSLDLILREGALDPERAVHIAAGVADALAAAHGAGLVHRDIKPGNVMVSAGDSVKVLDFGIARAVDATALTKTASLVGTVPFMAPEVAMGKPADERSDIYSLGCLVYSMLTGAPPFMADNSPAILNQHVHATPCPLREANPAVPPALDALVMQMLAKSPEERPQNAGEVRDRLLASLREAPTVALPPALEATAPSGALDQTPATAAMSAGSGAPGRLRRRHLLALLAAALLAAGLAIAALALTSGGSSPRRATSTQLAPSSTASQPAVTTTAPASPIRTTTTTSTAQPPAQTGTPPGQAKKQQQPQPKSGTSSTSTKSGH